MCELFLKERAYVIINIDALLLANPFSHMYEKPLKDSCATHFMVNLMNIEN